MIEKSSKPMPDDCFAYGGELMRHDDAIKMLLERTRCTSSSETIPLAMAAGRILAAPVIAPRPIPAFDNAAMDGYAMAHASLSGETELPVTATVAAGHPLARKLKPGEAVRIFTGAKMPEGADTVVMQEIAIPTERGGKKFVIIPGGIKKGANHRLAGEDVAKGAELVTPGTRLRPQDIAAIASTGTGEVECYAPLKVALVSSGDEIIRPGEPFRPGAVYDSNTFLLNALLSALPVTITDLGILPDRLDIVRDTLKNAAQTHDLILTSGGSSQGDEDHMSAAVEALGSLNMWRLAIKPGKPLGFGQIGKAVFLGLPGNPVAAAVTFWMYATPLLARMGGANWQPPRRLYLPSAFDMPSRKTGRREFMRGSLVEKDGQLHADKFARDGSGLISSLRESDGLIELPEDLESIAQGDLLAFIPYEMLGV